MTGILPERFVWYKGSIVNISSYPKLFNIFGTKFGGDGVTTFGLPDLTGRVLQGAEEICNYLVAALPDITGQIQAWQGGRQGTADEGAAVFRYAGGAFSEDSGFKFQYSWSHRTDDNGGHAWPSNNPTYSMGCVRFNASSANALYTNTNTVQPPAFTVRYMARYK